MIWRSSCGRSALGAALSFPRIVASLRDRRLNQKLHYPSRPARVLFFIGHLVPGTTLGSAQTGV